MNSYKRVALLGSLLALTVVSVGCGSSTPNTPVALESFDEQTIPLASLELASIARSANPANILVITPADLNDNNDLFVPFGAFNSATHFNISDLVTTGQLLEGWPSTADRASNYDGIKSVVTPEDAAVIFSTISLGTDNFQQIKNFSSVG